MEVLLLDTTEKEGEDNTLYHYVHSSDTVGCFSTPSRTNTTHWLDLRGVLAAAVGATTSLCGEPLKFARFGDGANASTGIVGFVNIYEVLYALAFTSSDIPEAIIQYYTRSSCDLLLSLLGYPDAKLGQWRRRDGSSVSPGTLSAQLDTIFRGICSVIHKDLSFGSHLHFAFDGRVPAVNYPLETMAKLAALDAPFGDTTTSMHKYTAIGRCVFYRKQLAFSTMRSDFLRLLFQWLLAGEQFAPGSSVTEPPNGSACIICHHHRRSLLTIVMRCVLNSAKDSDGPPTRIDTFELHDFRFTRHGGYPKRHALLIITKGNLQLVFLIERKLEFEGTDDASGWAKTLSDDVNLHSVEEVFAFCNQHLDAYLESTHKLRQECVETLQTQFADQLQREPEAPIHEKPLKPFLWYSVALDRLRGVIIGDVLPFTHLDAQDQRIKSHRQHHDSILVRFVQHIVALQQSTRCMHDPIAAATSPELPSGIRPLKLNVDDPDTLFLREKPTDEGDISTGDAHIFPELQYTHEPYENKGRELRQTAERVFVQGQPFWIIATHFETLAFFSILDAALPLELLEHEMNRLCAFGGADPATTLEPDE